MKKISIKDFKFYYKNDAIFFSEDNLIVDLNKNSPFVNFKEGLDKSQYLRSNLEGYVI